MPHSIAIVGGGPKGLYSLERLIAELAHSPLREPVEIHVYNKSAAWAAGDVYDPEQPLYLMMNSHVGSVTMWASDGPPPVVPEPLSLRRWCKRHHPEWSASGGFAPRAVAGAYLKDGLRELLAHLPRSVTVRCHRAEVVDLWRAGRGYGLCTSVGSKGTFDAVLLATGYGRNRLESRQAELKSHAEASYRAHFITDIYPTQRQLSRIPPAARVGVLGMSLSFIDVALTLTEGRGGIFEPSAEGGLRYVSSGLEPAVLAPFSRSGLLPLPKAADHHRIERRLHFLTEAALRRLKGASLGGQLDFHRDIWPLLVADMEWAYLECWLRRETGTSPPVEAGDLKALRALAGESGDGVRPFSLSRLMDTGSGAPFGPARHAEMMESLRREIDRAQRGIGCSPHKAALDVWRWARERLIPLMNFGGLTPASDRELRRVQWPALKRLVFGPPLINAQKILALADAGIVQFDASPGSVVRAHRAGGFRIVSPGRQDRDIAVEHLIDARVDRPSLTQSASPLYQRLLQRGIARPFVNRSSEPQEPAYLTGAVDVEPGSCAVRGPGGLASPMLCAIGIPTEGAVFGNESLSRQKNPFPSLWARNVVGHLRAGKRRTGSRRSAREVCVVGAGHGGLGLAGWLSLQGHSVRLLNRSEAALLPIRQRGVLRVEGRARGLAGLRVATTDPCTALEGVSVVMVAVPAFAHASIAEWLAPHLDASQIVLLSPGRTLGAVDFSHALLGNQISPPIVAEAQTLLVASRSERGGQVQLLGVKRELPVAMLGAQDSAVFHRLKELVPQVVQAESTLETSINNIGAILHPALALLNSARMAADDPFKFYHEGATPAIGRVLDQADRERSRIAAALGTPFMSAADWLRRSYGARGATLGEVLRSNESYRLLRAPESPSPRYVFEDVPYGLVPMSSLARSLDVAVPTIESLIGLASVMYQKDFRRDGRTLSGLGLSVAELVECCRSPSSRAVSPAIDLVPAPSAAARPEGRG